MTRRELQEKCNDLRRQAAYSRKAALHYLEDGDPEHATREMAMALTADLELAKAKLDLFNGNVDKTMPRKAIVTPA